MKVTLMRIPKDRNPFLEIKKLFRFSTAYSNKETLKMLMTFLSYISEANYKQFLSRGYLDEEWVGELLRIQILDSIEYEIYRNLSLNKGGVKCFIYVLIKNIRDKPMGYKSRAAVYNILEFIYSNWNMGRYPIYKETLEEMMVDNEEVTRMVKGYKMGKVLEVK